MYPVQKSEYSLLYCRKIYMHKILNNIALTGESYILFHFAIGYLTKFNTTGLNIPSMFKPMDKL
jgi:hypothetical protein